MEILSGLRTVSRYGLELDCLPFWYTLYSFAPSEVSNSSKSSSDPRIAELLLALTLLLPTDWTPQGSQIFPLRVILMAFPARGAFAVKMYPRNAWRLHSWALWPRLTSKRLSVLVS